MTRRSLNFVLLTPVLLLVIKVLILLVEIIYVIVGHESERQFFALDNLHNLAAIPVGLIGIYGYNMFLIIIPKFVPEKTDTVMGLICLALFVLFDCTRLFFVFLTGTGMQTCVPPFMSVDLVSHFLKNCIKGFLATFIGVPFLTICKDKLEYPLQVGKKNKYLDLDYVKKNSTLRPYTRPLFLWITLFKQSHCRRRRVLIS